MATVQCSVCGKDNELAGKWNYCRGCGGRLTLPVAQTTVRAAEGGNKAVTATAVQPATTRRKSASEATPRRTERIGNRSKQTKQELAKELLPWTVGLIIIGATLGMILGSAGREHGVQYGLLDDPSTLGTIGGIVTGGLLAQAMLWYHHRHQ